MPPLLINIQVSPWAQHSSGTMMWESLVGPRVRIRLSMWCQWQSNREADIPKRPHFSWTRTWFKCRKKTSATRDLCLSLSHSHYFPVSTNNLPWKWWHRRKEKDRTPQFLLISVLPYSSVSRRQSVGRRCWSHKKKMKTLLVILCSVSTFSGTNGTYLYRSCKIKVIGFQWFPISVKYAYICI